MTPTKFTLTTSKVRKVLKDNQIRLLVDEDATRQNIISMNEIFLKADENDDNVYYSGHGLEGTFLPIDYDGFKNALHHDEIKEIFNKKYGQTQSLFCRRLSFRVIVCNKSPFASSLMYFYEELENQWRFCIFHVFQKQGIFTEDGGLRQGIIFSHFSSKA